MQSGLGLKFGTEYLPLSSKRREEYRSLFEELEVIIIDEFSMVSADALYDIHKRLQEIFVSEDLFAGKAILLVGDLLQLPPVKGTPIYSKPYSKKSQALWSSDENLWHSFEVVTLTVSHRQAIGEWLDCLNRLRKGEMNSKDVELLEGRRLQHFPELNQKDATHAYYTNDEVDLYNQKMMDSMDGDYQTITAECSFPRLYKPYINPNGLIDTTPFRMKLSLKNKVRVMLTFNVSITDGLINGAVGTIIGFVFGTNSSIKAIIVKFDDPNVGEGQRLRYQDLCKDFSDDLGVPIFRSTLEYTGTSKNSMKPHGTRCRVTQFPLRPAFASTGHKMQGITIPKGSNLIAHGVVQREKKKKLTVPKSLYYVMLSRCSSIDNVFLDKNFELDKIKCNPRTLMEAERLDFESVANKLKEECLEIFCINIRSLSKHSLDLLNDFYASQAKYVCLTETWIDPAVTNNYAFGSKTVCHSSAGKGRGCCILLPQENPRSMTFSNQTFQFVSVPLEAFQLTVVYITHDPNLDMGEVAKQIDNVIDKAMPQVVVGDFNFDTKENNLLKMYLTRIGLIQMVNEPTHVEGRTLDHLYVSSELYDKVTIDVQFKYYSDHSALQIKLKE